LSQLEIDGNVFTGTTGDESNYYIDSGEKPEFLESQKNSMQYTA